MTEETKKKIDHLLWIDLEMTGLDVDKEVIIEVAAIVTDLDFNTLDTYTSVVKQPQHYIDDMDKWNTSHHQKSGLTAQIPNGESPIIVEEKLCQFVSRHFPGDTPVILAGNSIGQDRKFIDKYFTRLSDRLHYRLLDVTAWKIIFEGKYGKSYKKEDSHRALDDIKESIGELKFYMDFLSIS